MSKQIVVIGGGPAATMAAIEARKRDGAADVILLTDETCEPYEKPPLSKAALLGKAAPEDAPIAGKGGLAAHGVAVRHGARCQSIDAAGRAAVTADGRLSYDALVLATGSVMRELPLLPIGMPQVHYLRTDAQARALKSGLAGCKSLLVVGAGLIGLEVAASAAELGCQVTVVEYAPRIMARACSEETSAFLLAEHQHHGVEVELNVTVTQVTRQQDGNIALESGDGDIFIGDHVVVGTGVIPDDTLAAAAGLEVRDGIVVDERCRTSAPGIFAAGDCTRFPGPGGLVRLENWRHALDHGAVAGRNAAGADESYRAVPSFWSEQYDLYIQGVGWPDPAAQAVQRPMQGKAMLLMQVRNGAVCYAEGVNAQRELAALRRLIERRIPVDAAALADPGRALADMLKAKAG